MFDNIQIYIPSRSRAQGQKTIYNLSKNLWEQTSLIVPLEQLEEYRVTVPICIKVFPFDKFGISVKRNYMLNMNTTGKVIMLDDDLRFYKRVEDGKFIKAAPEDSETMVSTLSELLDRYPYVGVADKFMSQARKRGFQECQRFNQILCFNRDLLPKPWPRFRLNNSEEHDMHLQLLTRGCKTAISTEWSKTHSVDGEGGCQDWRTILVFEREHAKMIRMWPELVVRKNAYDVRINWKRAKQIGGIA